MFRNVVGFDFNPIKVVYEIQDLESQFWNKVLAHSALHGILYGFGVKNALAFQWKYWEEAPFLREASPHASNTFQKRASMNDFPIPAFAVFNDHAIVEKYKQERKIIQKLYHGRDFLELTLEQFTSPEDLRHAASLGEF